jgi:hypothetical protein
MCCCGVDGGSVESVSVGSGSVLGADVVLGTDYLPFQLRQAIARNNDGTTDNRQQRHYI